MSSVDEVVIAPVEKILGTLPFGTYPLGRAALTAGAGATFAFMVRPSVSFHDDGTPREWILLDQSNPQATIFPWWAWSVLPGVFFGIFV